MKNRFTLFCLALIFISNSQAATLTVNNTYPTVGQYSTVQSAVNAAASGDTILIQGSQTSYENVVDLPNNKALTLRGAGWNPTKPYRTVVPQFWFAPLAHDITIEGIEFSGNSMRDSAIDGKTIAGQYNITFQYCRGDVNLARGCHDIKIFHLKGSVAGNAYTSNITIRYCILNGLRDFLGRDYDISGFPYDVFPPNLLIDHNVFQGTTLSNLKRATITNNIFYESDVSWESVRECFISNNITYNSVLASRASFFTGNAQIRGNYLSNNFINVDPLFVAPYFSNAYLERDDLHLQASSVGKNAGLDGKDIGIYTDVTSFSKTGEVTPAVRTFQINTPSTTPNGTLNVKMTASKARDGN